MLNGLGGCGTTGATGAGAAGWTEALEAAAGAAAAAVEEDAAGEIACTGVGGNGTAAPDEDAVDAVETLVLETDGGAIRIPPPPPPMLDAFSTAAMNLETAGAG